MKPPIYEVQWEDHSFTFGDGAPKLARVRSVGYLVEDTDDHIAIALSYVDGKYNDTQLVDKRMVRKVKRLRG